MAGIPTVVVMTANSNTGGAAIEVLTTRFNGVVNVRGVVRKKASAADLTDLGPVELITGDIAKPLALDPVFGDESVRTAYFAVPTTPNRAELGKKFVDACFEFGVEYGVITSIIGADTKATEYQRQFAEIEEYALSKAGQSVKLKVGDKGQVKFKPIILRAANFYQNIYGSLTGIQSGVLYYPLEHGRLVHVDLNDVGKCVAHILANPEPHANKIYNLIGESQAGNQLASTIGMKAGIGCQYSHVDDDTAVAAFEALGLKSWIAKGNVEMLRWMREGGGQDLSSDIEAITGEKPTRFGDFVRDSLKPLLNQH